VVQVVELLASKSKDLVCPPRSRGVGSLELSRVRPSFEIWGPKKEDSQIRGVPNLES
jgi:hypothetical protein